MRKIKVLLADGNDYSRHTIKNLLELDDDLDIVAEAGSGPEVLEQTKLLEPHVIIMDLNLPLMDGFQTTSYVAVHHPRVAVIMISINDELPTIKKAMLAGAREYMVKPLSPAELHKTIRQVVEFSNRFPGASTIRPTNEAVPENRDNKNRIVSIFSTKGGVGKSVIVSNLAVAMAQKYRREVALIDLDIQFGDVSIIMNLNPRKTITELVQEREPADPDLLEDYMYERNEVDIMAAANKPELSELVTPEGISQILSATRQVYKYTFLDTPSFIDETTLTALEHSDLILLVITLDLPTINNVKKGIEILNSLQLLSRTRLILNRSSGVAGIEPGDVEKVLKMKIQADVPSDGKLVVASVNQGIPFIKMNPRAGVSKGIMSVMQVVEQG